MTCRFDWYYVTARPEMQRIIAQGAIADRIATALRDGEAK